MGLFGFLRRLFGGTPVGITQPPGRTRRDGKQTLRRPKLEPLQYPDPPRHRRLNSICEEMPYAFARHDGYQGYIDATEDTDFDRLRRWDLPELVTPQHIAKFLGLPLGDLGWLAHRFTNDRCSVKSSHYHQHWVRKRSGDWRLIESPKGLMKEVLYRILHGIVEKVPPHQAAHGFVRGRSVLSNAKPHVGQGVLLKFDLENFYATVRFNRVVAIFRGMGYCRETAQWLGRLVTSPLPWNLSAPSEMQTWEAIAPFAGRKLPQGAPTSPGLANLSAFSLDVRLAGMANAYGATYTRYADDLCFSGPRTLIKALPELIPLVTQIIRDERFVVNRKKRRVVRDSQRQIVTGVVVNEKPNLSRAEFDRLKAILTNCLRHGPASQNREGLPDFEAHLRGKVAHATFLSPARGQKLRKLFEQIQW